MSFVHLHVHSEYSLLDGFSNIKKLVTRAKEMNMPAVALTDHGTMFGVIDFYNAAKKVGVKPIIGVESYLAPRGMASRDPQFDKKSTHILLLAENQTGYQNLLQLASRAQLNGFYYYPRIDHETLAAYSEGLICTSGCMSAEVPRLINDGNFEGARKQLDWYYETFGKDRFFLELQQHDIPELDRINKQLLDLGRRYDANFVATNDVHYIDKEDARYQDIMLAVQTSCLLSDPNRMRMTDNSYYLRSPEEMARAFSEVPDALSNTLLIAERCEVDLGFKGYHLPEFPVEEGWTAESYLRSLCDAGLKKRYGSRADDDPILCERLEYELGVIHKMGFDAYFLIVWDLCRHARERNIWYNARGSAAGSIVAYTLDITMVDPIYHGLIFERFLNPGRISMPDIDLDFRDDRRAEMLEYTAHKYGDDKVAQIITFGTLGARAALRDVGRVMDIPLPEVDRVAKLVPNIPGKPFTIEQALLEVPDFKAIYDTQPHLRDLITTAQNVEGVVRNAGTHAAGLIITDKPVVEYVPLHRPTGNQGADSPIKTVSQFEMGVIDSLGLLKVDFLGLATLTIMARACDMIFERHGVALDLTNIPVDDPGTYELMGRGDTLGVFQVEGSGMRRWLMEMKPKELKHVIAIVALFRPGPMDFIPGYIRRMHGEEPVDYRHPMLEEIFHETYGYPVYQEQLMFAVMKLANYTAPEADDLRKVISKKLRDKLDAHKQKFIAGSVKNGIPQETAQAIFEDWEEFARYGFNKSHAADYGVIAVQTAYLKLHYPVEYMTALLSVSKNESEKVALYVADARRMGVPVEPPDVNASEWDFAIEDRPDSQSAIKAVIRFGLGAIKNVGQGPVEAILKVRLDERFSDLNDFARRVDLRQVGKRALECMIKVGALDQFGPRPALLESLDRIVAVSTSHFRAAETGQMSLFGAHTGVVETITLPAVKTEISQREQLNWERELIGLFVSDHPLSPVMHELTDVVTHFSGQLSDLGPEERVRVAGIVTRVRNHQTKAGKPMAFVTIEDLQGPLELVLFPRTWERYWELLEVDRIVLVDGKVDAAGGDPKILVDAVTVEFEKRYAESEMANRRRLPVHGARPAYRAPGEWEHDESPLPPADWDADMPPAPDAPPWAEAAPLRPTPAAPSPAAVAVPATTSSAPITPSAPVAPAAAPPAAVEAPTLAQAQPAVAAETTVPVAVPPTAALQNAPAAPVEMVVPSAVLPTAALEAASAAPAEAPAPEATLPAGLEAAPATPADAAALEPVPAASAEPLDGLDAGDSYDEPPEPDYPEDWHLNMPPADLDEDAGDAPAAPTYVRAPARRSPAFSPAPPRNPAPVHSAAPGLRVDDTPALANKPAAPAAAPQEERRPASGDAASAPLVNPPVRRPAAEPPPNERPSGPLPYLVSPIPQTEADGEIRMLTLTLMSTNDKTRDVLRIHRLYGMIISYPGDDRFAFQMYERGRYYLAEFPNSTCGICQEMLERLAVLVGGDNIRIEPIKFQ